MTVMAQKPGHGKPDLVFPDECEQKETILKRQAPEMANLKKGNLEKDDSERENYNMTIPKRNTSESGQICKGNTWK